jgi:cellulose biosynthesis protein BcsQ
MATYAIWNNKGGVGKSYLTFQISCEYARTHANEKVLVIDLCPQANASGMLLGGMIEGEKKLDSLCSSNPRRTIAGYIRERIASPYHDPHAGVSYLIEVSKHNPATPANLFMVVGDGELEVLASRTARASIPGPDDAWVKVHHWISDLVEDIKQNWNINNVAVFIDCNPSFSIYTELAMSASDRLIIPFSADGSSKRAVRGVLALLYGITRTPGGQQSDYFLNSNKHKLQIPKIYYYIGNRLTQAKLSSAAAFRAVVQEIGDEIWDVWKKSPGSFSIHPNGSSAPTSRREFRNMFQFEIVDANTASVVSSSLGIPIIALDAGKKNITPSKTVTVNQTQLDRQQPNIRELVQKIE